MITILAAQTDAGDSQLFFVGRSERPNESRPTAIYVPGLAGSEEAHVEFSHDGGNTWTDLLDSGGAVKCTASQNVIVIDFPGTFRVHKDATVGSVAVYIGTPGNP